MKKKEKKKKKTKAKKKNKKNFFKKFAKCSGKYLYRCLFSNKIAYHQQKGQWQLKDGENQTIKQEIFNGAI